VDGIGHVKYKVSYTCLGAIGEGDTKHDLQRACIDLTKKLKNANSDSSFYQGEIAKDRETALGNRKLSFESETSVLTPFDYLRLLFLIAADQVS
jgi:hypothetical protein